MINCQINTKEIDKFNKKIITILMVNLPMMVLKLLLIW